MKTEEDEAFDELAKRQGMWGGGFPAKRAMAADKLHWSDCAVHNGPAYPAGECDCGAAQDGKCKLCVDGCIACDARAQPAQEQWKCVGPPCKCNASNAKQCCYAVFTTPPKRERVLFPTMLRKMWSGGEVQAWLDENVNEEKNA